MMASSSKQVTVEDASPSPPPLPKEPLPGPSATEPIDEPIHSLGDDELTDEEEANEEESGDEWDPAAEHIPGDVTGENAKGNSQGEGELQPWQAVWAPEQQGELQSACSLFTDIILTIF